MQASERSSETRALRTHMEEVPVKGKPLGKSKKVPINYFLRVHCFNISGMSISMTKIIEAKLAEVKAKYQGLQDPLKQDGHPFYDGDKKRLLVGNGPLATALREAGFPYKGTVLHPSVV